MNTGKSIGNTKPQVVSRVEELTQHAEAMANEIYGEAQGAGFASLDAYEQWIAALAKQEKP